MQLQTRSRPSLLALGAALVVGCGAGDIVFQSGGTGGASSMASGTGGAAGSGGATSGTGGATTASGSGGAGGASTSSSTRSASSSGSASASSSTSAASSSSSTTSASSSTGASSTASSGGPTCGPGDVCVAAAPPGWTGPVQVYEGAAPPPSCPPLTNPAFTGGAGLSAPSATCSTCTCGAPSGVTCGAPIATLYTSSTCGGASCAGGTLSATCAQIKTVTQCTGIGAQVRISVSSQASGGACAASPQTPSVPPATWAMNAQACAPTGAPVACGAGEVCAASPASPFALCIYQTGDVPCPPGAYATRSVIDTGIADGRTCTGCSCGAPSTSCTGGQITVSPNLSCGGGVMNTVPSTCVFDGIPSILAYYAQVVTPATPTGSCAPSGGQPAGTAVPTGPITVCCQ